MGVQSTCGIAWLHEGLQQLAAAVPPFLRTAHEMISHLPSLQLPSVRPGRPPLSFTLATHSVSARRKRGLTAPLPPRATRRLRERRATATSTRDVGRPPPVRRASSVESPPSEQTASRRGADPPRRRPRWAAARVCARLAGPRRNGTTVIDKKTGVGEVGRDGAGTGDGGRGGTADVAWAVESDGRRVRRMGGAAATLGTRLADCASVERRPRRHRLTQTAWRDDTKRRCASSSGPPRVVRRVAVRADSISSRSRPAPTPPPVGGRR